MGVIVNQAKYDTKILNGFDWNVKRRVGRREGREEEGRTRAAFDR